MTSRVIYEHFSRLLIYLLNSENGDRWVHPKLWSSPVSRTGPKQKTLNVHVYTRVESYLFTLSVKGWSLVAV